MRCLRKNIDELVDRAHLTAVANFQAPENEVVDDDVQQTTIRESCYNETTVTDVRAPVAWWPRIIDTVVATPLVRT
ncbi:hypothetical protein TNCV_3424911 [Trichonephila clavipes]|nr:hypothetical protein TNCV_3424911 [Trichonephila clavipes]